MQALKSLEVRIRRLRNKLAPMLYKGSAVHCPVCEHSFSHFLPTHNRLDAICPLCRARERDRLTWLYLQSHPDLLPSQYSHFLHIAPEPCLENIFRARITDNYVTADLVRRDVMVNFDISDTPYSRNVFEIIYCSHVLQDCPNDIQAMQEFYRILKPNGYGIFNVPINRDRQITLKNSNPKVHSKYDKCCNEHIHLYGADYHQRLESVGFKITVITAQDIISLKQERIRLGIDTEEAGYVHLARK